MNPKYLILFLFFLVSCSNRYTVKIKDPINPMYFDLEFGEQDEYLKSEAAKKRKIIAGRLEYTSNNSKKSFHLCLEDINLNGSYTDFGIDAIGITEEDAVVIFEIVNNQYFGTGASLNPNLVFNFHDDLFKIVHVDTTKNSLQLEYLGRSKDRKVQDFQLTKYLPNLEFKDLFTSDSCQLYDKIDRSKKWHLVVFWAAWCPPCIDEFPLLKELSEDYGVELIHLCNVEIASDIEEARQKVKEFEVPGIHGITNMNAERALHQNGFPYLMLYDSNLEHVERILPISELVNIVAKDE